MTHTSLPGRPMAVDVLPDFSVKPRRNQQPAAVEALPDAPPAPVAVPVQAAEPAPESFSAAPCTAKELLLAISASLPATEPTAVVHIGLDNFRNVNAAFGPELGDQALDRAGELLAWALAPAPVARLTSDVLAALVQHRGAADLEHRVRRALSLLGATDLSLDGQGIRTTASAGITLLDRPGLTPRSVLHEADLAMATAKRTGRNRYAVHDAMETASASALQSWASQIRSALENDTFILHAQVVQALHTTDEQQWELLLRLPDPDGELLPPGQFLPVAERFGLVTEVDRWVTKKAFALIAGWRQFGRALTLEVNIGASTLSDDAFIELVESELARTGIDPRHLVFEVNGSVAGAQMDSARVFAERLKALGCRFALDGFGHAAGTLEQLKYLPLDFVKIDGSFVRHVATDDSDRRIVRGLTALAKDMGCRVIAMNVGDEATRVQVAELGVDFVQGFHIGRPVPLGESEQ